MTTHSSRRSCKSSRQTVVLPAPPGPVMIKSGCWRNGWAYWQNGQMAKGPEESINFSTEYSPHCGQTLNKSILLYLHFLNRNLSRRYYFHSLSSIITRPYVTLRHDTGWVNLDSEEFYCYAPSLLVCPDCVSVIGAGGVWGDESESAGRAYIDLNSCSNSNGDQSQYLARCAGSVCAHADGDANPSPLH